MSTYDKKMGIFFIAVSMALFAASVLFIKPSSWWPDGSLVINISQATLFSIEYDCVYPGASEGCDIFPVRWKYFVLIDFIFLLYSIALILGFVQAPGSNKNKNDYFLADEDFNDSEFTAKARSTDEMVAALQRKGFEIQQVSTLVWKVRQPDDGIINHVYGHEGMEKFYRKVSC